MTAGGGGGLHGVAATAATSARYCVISETGGGGRARHSGPHC